MSRNGRLGTAIIPSMSAQFAELLVATASANGIQARDVIQGTFLNTDMLGLPGGQAPCASIYVLANKAAEKLNNPYLCFELSLQFDWLSGVPVLDELSSGPSIADLLICWLKHTHSQQNSTLFELTMREETTVIVGRRLHPTRHSPGQADAWDMATWFRLFEAQIKKRENDGKVSAMVSDPAAIPPSALERVEQGPTSRTEFRFPTAWLLADGSELAGRLAEKGDAPKLREDLRNVFRLLDYSALSGFPELAAFVGYTPRALQRRMACEAVTHSDLAEDARRFQAERLLGELSVTQVSRALGYSNPTAFTRAFRRWNGTSPIEWLKKSRHK